MDVCGLLFKLLVVGGNWNLDMEKEVYEMFELLKQQGKVIFIGFKVGDDLVVVYVCGDVFFYCFVIEIFGFVVFEFMVSGVLVVVRDEGGFFDIVEYGDIGFLVFFNDFDGFVVKVMKLVLDEKLCQCMFIVVCVVVCECIWDKINNKVVWCMVDIIVERE